MRAQVRYWLAPGLPPVEMIAADYGAQRFSMHWHAGYAIGVVTRGAQRFRSEGAQWRVAAGDVITLHPGQLHDGEAATPGGWSSRMAYVPEDVLDRELGGLEGQGFGACVRHAPEVAARFLRWHELSQDTANAGPALQAFAELLRHLRGWLSPSTPRPVASHRLELASAAGPVERLGTLQGSGRSRFTAWRQTKAAYGLAPRPLATHLRLIAAKRMLAEGVPIASAAAACGFHDQSHFTRQFCAAYGMSPAQFRRAHLACARR